LKKNHTHTHTTLQQQQQLYTIIKRNCAIYSSPFHDEAYNHVHLVWVEYWRWARCGGRGGEGKGGEAGGIFIHDPLSYTYIHTRPIPDPGYSTDTHTHTHTDKPRLSSLHPPPPPIPPPPVLPAHCITCTKRRGEILVAACPKPSLVSQAGDPGHGTEATSPRLDTQTVIVVRAYVLYVHAILYALRADLFVFPSSFFLFLCTMFNFRCPRSDGGIADWRNVDVDKDDPHDRDNDHETVQETAGRHEDTDPVPDDNVKS